MIAQLAVFLLALCMSIGFAASGGLGAWLGALAALVITAGVVWFLGAD